MSDERTEPTGWEIAVAVNAVVKGLLGAMGQSGHVCREAIPVQVGLDTEAGYPAVLAQAVDALRDRVRPGDAVVIADKVLAAAQGRICSADVLDSPDPKTVDESTRVTLARSWQERSGMPVTALHLLLADEYTHPSQGRRAVLGCADHNAAAHDLARAIRSELGVVVDVVVSDTDTGIDVRRPLIGTVTFGATPLGATAGLTLYECMRCACAAEFVRGHDRLIPLVICRPADRCADRRQMGLHRGYGGVLDRDREGGLTYD
ncbi:hypothetical protein [Micromonospora sp. RP3T]|uniref:hypothetical protein n=1 Tax=Micromonospora sp. RP3T TaxID=2135446 RepID=UPI003D75740F